MTARLHLRIDSLALAGLGEADARRALRAFETELEAALASGALAATIAPQQLPQLRIAPRPRATPEATGRALAQALLARLGS